MAERIRILFLGELISSHAQSWINLLHPYADRFDVMGIGLVHPLPVDDMPFPARNGRPYDDSLLSRLQRRHATIRYRKWVDPIRSVYVHNDPETEYIELVNSLKTFRPHIVHTFGFTPAALIFSCLPKALRENCRWVLQTRGGSDLAFTQADPVWQSLFRAILPQADVVLCDNLENYRIFGALDIAVRKSPLLPFVPGTGGIDTSDFEPVKPLNERGRFLLWNKASETPWAKALPVLEGLRLAWPRIAPVRCVFTAVDAEVRNHVRLLPEAMREHIELRERIPRKEMLALMREARVILAPSLVDGIPNTLYEAMAAGAIPIVSPLPTLTPHFKENEQVVYVRNLYPEEIARALELTFDVSFGDSLVRANREIVAKMANRNTIAGQVAELYATLRV